MRRPPEGLRVLGDADIPEELAWPYIQQDGTRGRIILANNGLGIDSWNTHDLRKFASAVEGLGLGPDVLVGRSAFVFTDMLNAMERDGPRATLVAALGAVVVVVLLLGPGRAAGPPLVLWSSRGAGPARARTPESLVSRSTSWTSSPYPSPSASASTTPSTSSVGRMRAQTRPRAGRRPPGPLRRSRCARTPPSWDRLALALQQQGRAELRSGGDAGRADLFVRGAPGRPRPSPKVQPAAGADRGCGQAWRKRGANLADAETEQQASRNIRHPVMAKVDRREPQRNDERQAIRK